MLKGQILLVDDEVVYVQTIARQLQGVGFVVTSAYGGDEAVRILTWRRFDVAIVDVRMPGMDGLELLGVIKERWPDCAVIILTALDELETAIHAIDLGAFKFVRKGALAPVDFNRIVTAGVIAARLARGRRKALERFTREGGKLDIGVPPLGDSVPPVDQEDLHPPTVTRPDDRMREDTLEIRVDKQGSTHLKVPPKVLAWAKRGLIALLTWLVGLGVGWIRHKNNKKASELPEHHHEVRKGIDNDQFLP